jgi:hypothetical protein
MAGKRSEWMKTVTDAVEEFCSNYRVDVTGHKHLRVTLFRGDRSRFVIAPGTTSDSKRAGRNFRADVARVWKELKEQTND